LTSNSPAGGIPLQLHAAGHAHYVDSIGGHGVGLVTEPHFVATRFHLEAGDTLVLYTDGLTEAGTGSAGNASTIEGPCSDSRSRRRP